MCYRGTETVGVVVLGAAGESEELPGTEDRESTARESRAVADQYSNVTSVSQWRKAVKVRGANRTFRRAETKCTRRTRNTAVDDFDQRLLLATSSSDKDELCSSDGIIRTVGDRNTSSACCRANRHELNARGRQLRMVVEAEWKGRAVEEKVYARLGIGTIAGLEFRRGRKNVWRLKDSACASGSQTGARDAGMRGREYCNCMAIGLRRLHGRE
ncbi:hypothetical protein FB451DRAFT_1187695 [Mycena latifolia]|nr:hypothetical protein FB451DRAFT_1187695 [Mycena latifolia]